MEPQIARFAVSLMIFFNIFPSHFWDEGLMGFSMVLG
jgi:hypothetical protein